MTNTLFKSHFNHDCIQNVGNRTTQVPPWRGTISNWRTKTQRQSMVVVHVVASQERGKKPTQNYSQNGKYVRYTYFSARFCCSYLNVPPPPICMPFAWKKDLWKNKNLSTLLYWGCIYALPLRILDGIIFVHRDFFLSYDKLILSQSSAMGNFKFGNHLSTDDLVFKTLMSIFQCV